MKKIILLAVIAVLCGGTKVFAEGGRAFMPVATVYGQNAEAEESGEAIIDEVEDEENAPLDLEEYTEESSRLFSGSIVSSWLDGFYRSSPTTQLDQIWLTSERAANTERSWFDWGYRVDGLFGTNCKQSFGDGGFDGKWGISGDGYGASLYQAYSEVAFGKLSTKIGKFGTRIGYESDDASENYFSSYSNMYDHEPATHSGVIFDLAATDAYSIHFGMVSGADGSFQNLRGDTGFLFGADWNLSENVTLSYAGELNQVHSALGEDRAGLSYGYYYDLGGLSVGNQNESLHSIILDIQLSDRLNYAFVTDFGSMEDRAQRIKRYGQSGFANYLSYDLVDTLALVARYEYYDQHLTDEGWNGEGAKDNHCHDLTLGFNYRPVDKMFFRPEVRYDWVKYGDENAKGFTGGFGAGITF